MGNILKKYLIINVDDFGLSESVNRGVIEVFNQQNLSTASMFANLPGFDDAIKLWKNEPYLDIGLHFNLTYGYPVSDPHDIPSLVDSSGRFRYQDLDWKKTNWNEEEIKLELGAQWKKLVNTGLKPTHLDSHHYVHNYSIVYVQMSQLASEEKIPMRRTRKPLSPRPCLETDHLITEEYHGPNGLSNLLKVLDKLEPGISELNCHPGYSDKTVVEISDWTTERERELQVFLNPAIREAIHHHQIELINFRDMKPVNSVNPA